MAENPLPPRSTKICTKCGENQPLDEFYFIKALGSYLTVCKACSRAYQREYNRRPEELSDFRECASCGEQKPISEFYSRVKGGRLRGECSDCIKADIVRQQSINPRKRKTYAELLQENPEGVRKARRRNYLARRGRFEGWIKTNLTTRRQQCRKAGIDFSLTVQDVVALFNEQSGICALTGRELLWGVDTNRGPDTLSIDRIDASGPCVRTNIRLVTHWANVARQRFTDEEFIERCRSVVGLVDKPIIALMIASPKGRA
jgi:hypothetical protein